MSATDYVVDLLLIAVVLRQVRTRPLSLQSVVLPLVLVGIAGSEYLKGFPTGGNDVALTVIFTAIGLALGTLSAMATRVWRNEQGIVVAKAGVLAAVLWMVGMGFRFGFQLYADSSSGALSIARFSVHHHITSAEAWTTALVLMAFGEVLSRVAYLQVRRVQVARSRTAVQGTPAPAAVRSA